MGGESSAGGPGPTTQVGGGTVNEVVVENDGKGVEVADKRDAVDGK